MIEMSQCPNCGNPMINSVFRKIEKGEPDVRAIMHSIKCKRCGFDITETLRTDEVNYLTQIASVLSEHFCMPCDLCKKYFKCDDDVDGCIAKLKLAGCQYYKNY